MATPSKPQLRVMVDANVLLAGVGWPRFPYAVLRHGIGNDFQLVLSPLVIAEARKRVERIGSAAQSRLEAFLELCNYEEASLPTPEEVAHIPT